MTRGTIADLQKKNPKSLNVWKDRRGIQKGTGMGPEKGSSQGRGTLPTARVANDQRAKFVRRSPFLKTQSGNLRKGTKKKEETA